MIAFIVWLLWQYLIVFVGCVIGIGAAIGALFLFTALLERIDHRKETPSCDN